MEIKMGQDDQYQTRDGKAIRILAVDRKKPDRPVVAMLDDGYIITTSSDGRVFSTSESRHDIIRMKKKFRYERWFNINPDSQFMSSFTSKKDADLYASDRIACIKVVIEGTEGDGL